MARYCTKTKKAVETWIVICMIVGFWAILPLVFGGMALRKLRYGKPPTWLCVCTLLFCSAVAGTLLLCRSEEDFLPDGLGFLD